MSENHQISHPLPNLRIGYKPWLVSGILLFSDLSAIILAFLLSFCLRKMLIPLIGGVLEFDQAAPLFLLTILFILVVFAFAGFYPGHGRTGVAEFREIVYIVSFSHIVVAMIIFILGYGPRFSRLVFLFSWLITMVLITSFRLILHNRFSLRSWWGQPAVVVGGVQDATRVIRQLQSARRIGYKPVAAIMPEDAAQRDEILGVPVFSFSDEVLLYLRKSNVRLGIFTDRYFSSHVESRKHLQAFTLSFPKLIYVLGDSPLNMPALRIMDLDGHPALHMQYNLLNPLSVFTKRVADLTLSLLSLVLTFPLFVLFSLIIWINSPGPILYRQTRMGKEGKLFDIYKFRTMVVGAEEKLEEILEADSALREEFNKFHKLQNDPRVTRVGRFFRKSSFDEFPQIINIIKGEMSWVGPRAYLPSELDQMGESANIIHRVSPGLTGWWQVMGRHSVRFEDRLQLDEYYISNYSLLMDAFILLKTVFIVFTGSGA